MEISTYEKIIAQINSNRRSADSAEALRVACRRYRTLKTAYSSETGPGLSQEMILQIYNEIVSVADEYNAPVSKLIEFAYNGLYEKILEGDTYSVVNFLNIAADFLTKRVDFLNYGLFEVEFGDGRKKPRFIEPKLLIIGELRIGSQRLGEFGERHIDINNILQFIGVDWSGKRGENRRLSTQNSIELFVHDLFSLPFDEFQNMKLEGLSQEATFLLDNILTFRKWLNNGFAPISENPPLNQDVFVKTVVRLRNFPDGFLRNIGMYFGEQHGERFLERLLSIRYSHKVSREWLSIFRHAQKAVYNYDDKEKSPYLSYAQELGVKLKKEKKYFKTISEAGRQIMKLFRDNYKMIFDRLNTLKSVDITSEDSIFMQRYGIKIISVKFDKNERVFEVELVSTDGYRLFVDISNDTGADHKWAENICKYSGVPERQAYQIGIYIRACLIDLSRQKDKGLLNILKERFGIDNDDLKKKNQEISIIKVARRLFALGGFKNILKIVTNNIFVKNGGGQVFDFIDIETAEIVSSSLVQMTGLPVDSFHSRWKEPQRCPRLGYLHIYPDPKTLSKKQLKNVPEELLQSKVDFDPNRIADELELASILEGFSISSYDLTQPGDILDLVKILLKISAVGAIEYGLNHAI